MIDQKPRDTQPSESELWMILQDLEDGSLSESQRENLMSRLENSNEDRKAYLEYFQQSAVFRGEAAKMHELGLLPVVAHPFHSRRLFKRSILAAAAVITLCAILATLIAIKRENPGVLDATIVADTQWSVNGARQSSGTHKLTVTRGSTVNVSSGTVELRLASGAVMVLQGPALATFPELNRPNLKHGWLWIDSGKAKETFEIDTSYLKIRNIGTRFGVRVPETGPVEVHLISGQLELEKKDEERTLSTLTTTNSGIIIPPDDHLTEMTLAYDPFPGLPDLLTAKSNYRTTLMSQRPIGYWRFESSENGALLNEVLQGTQAYTGLEVDLSEPGVGSGDSFNGFGDNNKSAHLLAHEEKSALISLGGPNGVTRREGAVSFWIRRLPGHRKEEALWLAGEAESGGISPETSMIHTTLSSSGRVRFFIENGKFDIALSSSRNLADGQWHHIVASWGPTAVELFVNGKRVASDADSRVLQDGNFGGRHVRFGKPSLNLRSQGVTPFNGWVDELALWNRPLSHAEVYQQYQSAIGNSKDQPD